MRSLPAIALVFLTGCGHVPLDRVITAHNVYRRLLVDASDTFTPIYAAAANVAMHHEKEDDYSLEMEPYNGVVRALRTGQEAENLIHSALNQCIAQDDDTCDLVMVGFACAASALGLLSQSYGQVPDGTHLYAAAAVAEQQLRELARGANCEVQ